MQDGLDVPIGGDFTQLQAAFDKIVAAVDRVGERINQAMTRSEASTQRASAKLANYAAVASNVGNAVMGASTAINLLSRGSKILTGVSLGSKLTQWVSKAGGVRSAFAKIPGAMSAIAKNPTLRKVVVGAVAAAAAVVTIRGAYKVVSTAMGAAGRVTRSVFSGMVSAARSTAAQIGGIFRKVGSMPKAAMGGGGGGIPGLPIAGVVSVGAAVALLGSQIKGAVNEAAGFEDMRVTMEHFLGSVEGAKSLLDDLTNFSLKTPFETKDIQATAAGLLGAGIRDDVAGITKDLAALAKDGQSLGELGDAMAKGFAKGKFQTDDMNKFLERGINLLPELSAVTGLAGDALRKAIEKGLKFDDVTRAIDRMSQAGGQFYGLLERRSATTNGLISTLNSAFSEVKKVLGEPINDALKPILLARIESTNALIEGAKKLGGVLGRALSTGFAAFKEGRMLELIANGIDLIMKSGAHMLMTGFQKAVAFLAASLPTIFDASTAKLRDPAFWTGVAEIFNGIVLKLQAGIQEAFGNLDNADIYRSAADTEFMVGKKRISGAGEGDMGASISQALSDGIAAAKAKGAEFDPVLDMAQRKWRDLIEELGTIGDQLTQKAKAATDLKPNAGIAIGGSAKTAITPEDVAKSIMPAVTSLARIGGGGGGTGIAPMVSQQRITNGLLKKMLEKTGVPQKRTAVYG